MRSIEEMTAGLVKTYSAISEDKAKLFTPQREAIGTCPRCGAAVYEGKKNYYCSDRACSFVMWKNDLFFQQRKKTFTKAIAAALLKAFLRCSKKRSFFHITKLQALSEQ